MGKTVNFKANMDYKGTFDVSQIINSIKQLRKEIEGTQNIKLLGNLDSEISKVEKLSETISAQIGKGFSSQKEFNNFQSNIEKLELGFEKVSQQFSNINTDEFGRQLKEIEDNIKDLQKEAKTFKNSFVSAFTSEKTGLKGSSLKTLKKELDDAVKEGKSFETVQKEINKFFDQELDKQKKSVEFTKQQINLLEQQKTVVQAAAQSMGGSQKGFFSNFFYKTNMFKDKSGNSISKEKLQELRQAYVQIVQESNKAEEAQSKFLKLLEKENITIKATKYIMQGLEESYSIYSNLLNNDTRSITTLTKEQKKLNGELEKAPKVEQQINIQREKTLQTLQATKGEYNSAIYSIKALAQAEANQAEEESRANQQMQEQEARIDSLRSAIKRQTDNFEEASQTTQEAMNTQKKYNETLDQIKSRVGYILSLSNAYYQLRNIIRQTFQDVQELDKAFASIAMVTDKTVKDLWATYDDYSSIANKLGQATESAIRASALYYQQGLDTAEALELTENTMKLATLAGADFETATQQMTAALRGFKMEMTEGSHITDVYSQLAANAAADVNGIAYAMSKTSSIAKSAGMSFETTAAFLTNMIETTQEAPKLKIIA